MRITRSRAKNSSILTPSDEHLNSTDMTKKQPPQAITSQWVMIGPDTILDQEDTEERVTCKLPHPKEGIETLYMFHGKKMFEVVKVEDKFRSWFLEDTVQSDGSLHFLTPFDPLFMFIPYIQKICKEGKYMLLGDILVDPRFPSLRHLEACLTHKDLLQICAMKGSDDIVAYKLHEDKLMLWLKTKFENIAMHLKESKSIIKAGMSQTYNHTFAPEEYRYTAWELISDYLEKDLSEKLYKYLGIVEKEKENSKPAEAPKEEADGSGVKSSGDYRDGNDEKKSKKSVKRTAAQAKLDKIDKKGMKSLNSFFSPKAKK